MNEKILIIDFGSQYTQLIARRVRELEIYSEIVPCTAIPILDEKVKGIILSGSPFSIRDNNDFIIELEPLFNHAPLLGICFGAQLMAQQLGGNVEASSKREYGRAQFNILKECSLFENFKNGSQVWMSHADTIMELPHNSELIGSTNDVVNAAYRINKLSNPVYAVQFHPEVAHSICGSILLENFTRNICGLKERWSPEHFIDSTVTDIMEQVGDDQVILGLSGGVDSSVAAGLLHKAIGAQLFGVFIDNGLLRKNEFEEVLESYKGMGLNVIGVDSTSDFLSELEGISSPEEKRKIIGRVFIEVFEKQAAKMPEVKWLAQGTIYPDVIESTSVHGPSAMIKSHHNVGGLPDKLNLKIIEPLRKMFKDEVRVVGKALGLPSKIISRHPFPGPGLSVRLLGPISNERLTILKEADAIYINLLREHGWYDKIWQAGAILLPVQSVGVMGDERTYENVVALRAVNSVDGMTADWTNIPHELLAQISNTIINQVKGINRVVYDISSKPPATIEWE